jgi:hypothetical protein
LLPTLDTCAYITGLYALQRHNLVTQTVREITCFTMRRHNRSRVRNTPLGRMVFACVRRPIYAPPQEGFIVPPEQALCDFVYFTLRAKLRPESLVSFRRLETVDPSFLQSISERYPSTVCRWLKEAALLPQAAV